MPPSKIISTLPSIVSVAYAVLLISLTHGSLYFWNAVNAAPLLSAKYMAIGASVVLITALTALLKNRATTYISLSGLCLSLFLVIFGDWLTKPYSLLQAPGARAEILLLLVLACLVPKTTIKRLLTISPIAGIIIFIAAIITMSNGRQIFTDDHSVFYFRLRLLQENFPHIPFYYPLWNAGLDARDFFATGALNVFLIFSPLLELLNVESCYNFIVLSLLFGILPCSVYIASRIEGLRAPAPSVAALLAMTSSLLWYRWALKYGTLGFITSASLLPLVHALAIQLLDSTRKFPTRLCYLFAGLTSLMLLWSPSGLAILGLFLLSIRCLIRNPASGQNPWKRKQLWISALLLIIINLPWMGMMMEFSKVGNFLQSKKGRPIATKVEHSTGDIAQNKDIEETPAEAINTPAPKKVALSLKTARTLFREDVSKMHPLLLFLLLPGILLLPHKISRKGYAYTTLALIGFATIGAQIKPQLELDRMFVMLGIISSIPVSAAIAELFTLNSKPIRLATSLIFAFVIAGIPAVSSVLYNRTLEQYRFREPLVNDLANAIKIHAQDGRAVFSGFVLHELNDAHLAPLSILSGKPLVASSQFHNIWRYTDIMPQGFKELGPSGYERFFDYMNTSVVLAHDLRWQKYFEENASRYRKVWQGGKFTMYTRLRDNPSYFEKGNGQIISQDDRSVRFKLETPDAVLKFRYFPFLMVNNCAQVKPFAIAEAPELELIELKGCATSQELTLTSVSTWNRYFHRGNAQ